MATAYNFELTGDFDSDKQDEQLLKDWHFADLPDDYEIARNEYIFDLQGNRNPFIDSVDFVCFINFDDNVNLPNGCPVGIEEKLENNFVGYPVPANDKVYIQVNGTTISGYTVLDMQGRVVVSEHQSQLQLLEL